MEIHAGDFAPGEPAPPAPALRERLFPSRGFSALEILILANVLIGALLMGIWRESYGIELATAMRRWHGEIHAPWDAWRMIPTLFLHAGFGHLARNMVGLLAAGAVVETFYGPRRTVLAYAATGLTGAMFSFLGHARPPLSVGASGAVFGLGGMTAAFLLRYYPRFTDRQKWKTRRVYGPLFLLLVAPSLLQADSYAHVGGFLAGILLGLMLPLDREGRKHLRPEVLPPLALVDAAPGDPPPANPDDRSSPPGGG